MLQKIFLTKALQRVSLWLLAFLAVLGSGEALAQKSKATVNQYTPLIEDNGRNMTATSSAGLGSTWTWSENKAINTNTGDNATLSTLISLGDLTDSWLEVKDENAKNTEVYPAGSYAGFVVGNFGVADLSCNFFLTE